MQKSPPEGTLSASVLWSILVQCDVWLVRQFVCLNFHLQLSNMFILYQNGESKLLFTSVSRFLLWLTSSSLVFCFVFFLLICPLFHLFFFSYWDSGTYYNFTVLKYAVDEGLNHCSSLFACCTFFSLFGFIYLMQYLLFWLLFWWAMAILCLQRLWDMLVAVTK